MEIDWSMFPEYMGMAAMIVVATGGVGSATAEMIKQIWEVLTKVDIPAQVMSLLSAVVSVVLSAFALQQTGVPMLIAVCACICAVFTPKIAHDATRYIR